MINSHIIKIKIYNKKVLCKKICKKIGQTSSKTKYY